MALGVPILVSRTPIDQHYFNENNVAFFEPENEADFAAKVLELADNRSWREQLAQNGLAYISQNNWGVREQVYLQLVSRLCARGDGKHAAALPPPG